MIKRLLLIAVVVLCAAAYFTNISDEEYKQTVIERLQTQAVDAASDKATEFGVQTDDNAKEFIRGIIASSMKSNSVSVTIHNYYLFSTATISIPGVKSAPVSFSIFGQVYTPDI
ncbi:MAG: hypothetical protein J6C81_03200 [Muribaculaceae bacterium]|nr:hypothetical protein [Muribaculaceae bacterium]